ncbi:hypothetical protein HYS31_03595 [Candidatus Woesearchaeota archaeon]|nr:hypothetical protein [Candidatus Woesearchaeota archaeon]
MGCCEGGICSKCWGVKFIVVGVVLYLATWYAKGQNNIWLVWYTIAALLVLKGVMKLAMPMGCGHCTDVSMKKGKK